MPLDFLSPSWTRVAALRPRLRGHAEVHRHVYRGEATYVLQDHASRRVHHFNAAAYEVIGLMDGTRSLDDIWHLVCRKLGDGAPTQEDTIRLLAQLHLSDVLQCEIAPDLEELLRRTERMRQSRLLMLLLSPLSIKFPLVDPERFLARWLPWYGWLFGRLGALLWTVTVAAGVTLAALHWRELTGDITDRVLAPANLVMLWIVFPLIKALHELGHAAAVRRFGGEVHEMGVMLLVLLPIPYVDASSASAFPSKTQRVVVGAAGMAVELVIATLAMLVWLNAEPGLVRSLAYNIMFIAGVSTLVFNANPLMRFDGYYILSDLLEIPNLRPRSNRYLAYLADRFLFRAPDARTPVASVREGFWLVAFGTASFIYRIFIAIAIGLFIAGKYFFIGVVLALWSVFGAFILPLVRQLLYLTGHARLQGRRARALAASAGLAATLGVLLFGVPMPLHSHAEGILWVPREAIVAAGTDGFVKTVDANPDAWLRPGDAILSMTEPSLEAELAARAAHVEELRARYQAESLDERVRAALAADELHTAEAELARTRERVASLEVRSPVAGRLILPRASDLPAQFVRQGTSLAFVVDADHITARVIVPQQDADLVRSHTRAIEVRRADDPATVYPAALVREVPAATTELPNLALSTEGGGKAALDPRERGAPRALQHYFEFELRMPPAQAIALGERVYVRFDHGYEPLGVQWYRNLRQLFLRRLDV